LIGKGEIMASDGLPVKPFAFQPVQRSKPPAAATAYPSSGKSLPASGAKAPAQPVRSPPSVKRAPDLHALVAQLNERLQESGRPNQYRLNSSAGHQVIQEINPDTDQVIGEIPANEFKALAQELGISGLLVDAHA
jgi:uncharacterized FlaG/YvyC family protein